MQVERTTTVVLQTADDVVRTRQLVREAMAALKFSLVDQTKFVTASSEIARNTVTYGGGGSLLIESLTEGRRKGLRLVFEDRGPGIADVGLAMTDGYSTGGGLGMGLPGAKRLCNAFDLRSAPGQGTRVTLVRWTST
jgi:serine/threonine-protein kinase RsbT